MMTKEEPKNNSKFKDGDIVTIVRQNNGWTDCYIGIVIGPYIYGSDLSKTPINKALYFDIRYATEYEKNIFLSKLKELKKPQYTDKEVKEFANTVSHEWWQVAMDQWNTLTEDEKKKYNQYIGFNYFSDQLMNILISVLLGLKRNGKLVYEEGSLFSEPEQTPAKCIKSTRDLSQQHKETLPEREKIRNEILKQIMETVDFMDNACAVMDRNTAFIKFRDECSTELVHNTVYTTLQLYDFDHQVREFNMYLTYISERCDNVIEMVKDFRRLTTNRFLYMILNRIENDLEKVKKMVYYMVNKTNNKNE